MTTFPTRLMDHILTSAEFKYERTLASQVERLLELDIPIEDLWNPQKCPESLLPYLAWTVSVDIWDETWPTVKKRNVVARAIEMTRLKGTEEGIRQYVSLVDETLKEVLTPPQDFFAAGPPSKEEQDTYIRSLPQFKLYTGSTLGTKDGFYADNGFANAGYFTFDLGPALYGRRATYQKDGHNTDLKVYHVFSLFTDRVAVDVERISTPGLAGDALITDVSFAGHAYLDATPINAEIFTVELNRRYSHEESALWLTTLSPDLDPVNPRYERSSDIADYDGGIICSYSFAGESYATLDRSGQMMNDHLYLYDPDIPAPLGGLGGFADHNRIGMPAYTAEVMIEATRISGSLEGFSDGMFADQGAANPDDLSRVAAGLQAVTIAKALHDKVLVTFETTRPKDLDDGFSLDQAFNLDYNDRVAAHLI